MIPEGGKLQALILDLSHLGDLPLPRWMDMEHVYQVVYMERYEEDESILLWQANREKTITISRIHPVYPASSPDRSSGRGPAQAGRGSQIRGIDAPD